MTLKAWKTNDKNITAVQSENMEYQMKNMKEVNQVLQQRVQDLESQGTHEHEKGDDDENL